MHSPVEPFGGELHCSVFVLGEELEPNKSRRKTLVSLQNTGSGLHLNYIVL